MEWKALSCKISLFPAAASPLTASAMEIFRALWGTDPDSFQKHNNPLIPSIASGKSRDFNVTCSTQPSRIDLSIGPFVGDDDSVLYLIDNILLLQEELERLVSLLDRTPLSIFAARVAVNLHILLPEKSVRDANVRLQGIIPTRYGLRLQDEQDFFLQLNRPYKSATLLGVDMNLITQWIASKFQRIRVTLSADIMSSTSQSTAVADPESILASSVVFDLNSVPGERQFDSGEQISLLNEAFIKMWGLIREMGVSLSAGEKI